MTKTIPSALKVQPCDPALGLPVSRGKYYEGWQVTALQQWWPSQDITFIEPAGINFGRGNRRRNKRALARVAEIAAAFNGSGWMQAAAQKVSVH